MPETHDDAYYLELAFMSATASADPSTQNGAVLVDRNGYILSYGRNHIPACFGADIASVDRDTKLELVVHAEAHAILMSAGADGGAFGSTLYCPWAPCVGCAKAMVVAGVGRLVCHRALMDMTPARWRDDVLAGLVLLEKAGIDVTFYDGPIEAPEIRFDGSTWKPR